MNQSMPIPGFKVQFAQRNHSPIAKPISDHLVASLVLRNEISSMHKTADLADDTFLAGDRGRRRYEVQMALNKEYSPEKAGKRYLPPQGVSQEKILRGKKFIPPPAAKNDKEPLGVQLKRLAEPKAADNENKLPSQHWKTKRVVYTPDGKHLARSAPSNEHEVEKQMTQKHRVTTTDQMRNNVQLAHQHPGDNTYKTPDHATDFFVGGGLIPGSTNILRESAKPQFRKNEANTGKTENKALEATYGKMQARLAKDYDIMQVKSLTIGSATKQNQPIPSWEQRTGCFLVSPEDEAF